MIAGHHSFCQQLQSVRGVTVRHRLIADTVSNSFTFAIERHDRRPIASVVCSAIDAKIVVFFDIGRCKAELWRRR